MSKRTSEDNKEEDINLLAKSIVDKATEEPSEKNPAAVALGRLGGKGGKARAKILSPEKRLPKKPLKLDGGKRHREILLY